MALGRRRKASGSAGARIGASSRCRARRTGSTTPRSTSFTASAPPVSVCPSRRRTTAAQSSVAAASCGFVFAWAATGAQLASQRAASTGVASEASLPARFLAIPSRRPIAGPSLRNRSPALSPWSSSTPRRRRRSSLVRRGGSRATSAGVFADPMGLPRSSGVAWGSAVGDGSEALARFGQRLGRSRALGQLRHPLCQRGEVIAGSGRRRLRGRAEVADRRRGVLAERRHRLRARLARPVGGVGLEHLHHAARFSHQPSRIAAPGSAAGVMVPDPRQAEPDRLDQHVRRGAQQSTVDPLRLVPRFRPRG